MRYCYYYKTFIDVNNRFMKQKVYVHITYKAHLKTYHKEYFDAFRRSDKDKVSRKFIFNLENKKFKIVTCISQLHFIKWILTHGIIDHVLENYDKIIEKEDQVNKYFSDKSERSKKSKTTTDNTTENSSKNNSVTINRKVEFFL